MDSRDETPIGEHLGVYGMMIVTNPDYAAANPETVRSFIRATARGWAVATQNPEAAIDELVRRNATLERSHDIEMQKFRIAAQELQFTDHVRTAGWGLHESAR